ncbi:hypothetical protein BH23VER1_BH23VER1_14740 [soil metagenome]
MDRATLTFLHTFPERIRAEGEALQKAGCVKQIFGNHLFIQGRVEDGGEVFRTMLRLNGDEWQATRENGHDDRSSAAYATMLERVERGGTLPEAPNEVGEKSLPDIMESELGRSLTAFEEGWIDKLEKRYRRFEIERHLFGTDLVRLNSKWPVDDYEPLELWNEPPKDVLEFWNYIAYAFEKRAIGFPPFMRAVTDTEAVKEMISAWERERELSDWESRLDAVVGDAPPPPSKVALDFRLMVLPNEARLQRRKAGSAHAFETVSGQAEFDQLASLHAVGGLVLDGASELLWVRFSRRLQELEGVDFRLDDAGNCALLGRLFEQPSLQDRIVTLDENPFHQVEKPLRWVCRDRTEDDAEPDGHFILELITGDGEPLTHTVRVLPGVTTWYLSDETIFRGPINWTTSTEVEPRNAVPESALAHEKGVAFLAAIRAGLPGSLKARAVETHLVPRIAMRLSRRLTGADSEHLIAEVTASDPGGFRTESLTKEGWRIAESTPPPGGKIVSFDRSGLPIIPGLLDEMALSYDPGQEAFKTRATKTFPERFSEWVSALPEGIEVEMEDDLRSLIADPIKARVRFEISEQKGDIDWFDLKIVLDVEGLDLSQAELRTLVAARGGFVRMGEGGWLRLEFDLDEGQQAAVDRLGLDIYDLSGEQHRMHVLQLADPAAKEVFDEGAWNRICDRASSLKLRVQPKLPDGLSDVTLRTYQVEGFQFLSYLATNSFGGILADDMGLGKTVQSIAWLLWLRSRIDESRPALVVCPKSVLDVWAGECRKFAPQLRVQVSRTKEELDIDTVHEHDLLVLNYSQLRVNAEKLKSVRWLASILDEGQQIKNPDSKAAKSARELNADNRLVLTGTPIENRLLDIWSLMAFAMPGVLGNRKYFRERFDRRKDPGAQARLSARLRPFLLRRTKNQVAMDLPARTEEDVFCKLEGTQEELYNAELKRIQNILLGLESDEALRKNSFVVLQGLMRLRQICCHPALIDPAHAKADSAKLNALFYLLDQLKEEGHKVLVFSQFVTMLDIIRARLQEQGRPFEYLTGKTQDRSSVIERFQTTKDPAVFLLSLKAGGSGLNLTAASYVVLYDPWWNPAVENQAIDRTHRIGQTSKVIAYRLLMRDSVEEKIRILQHQKRGLVTGVLGHESFTQNLTRDDLAFLFEADPVEVEAG